MCAGVPQSFWLVLRGAMWASRPTGCGADLPQSRVKMRAPCAGRRGRRPLRGTFQVWRRAGTCAPPLPCRYAAAHGWPPYSGFDCVRRRAGNSETMLHGRPMVVPTKCAKRHADHRDEHCSSAIPALIQVCAGRRGRRPPRGTFQVWCRAGTCAPPLPCRYAAAHGWPPYSGCDRVRRRAEQFQNHAARTTDGRPYGVCKTPCRP